MQVRNTLKPSSTGIEYTLDKDYTTDHFQHWLTSLTLLRGESISRAVIMFICYVFGVEESIIYSLMS